MSNFLRRLAAAALVGCAVPPAHAATLSMAFTFEFSGAQAPSSPGPWLTALFADVSANVVRLTLSAAGLSGPENVLGAYFNLDPALSPSALAFSLVSASPGAAAGSVTTGVDCCKADGDGRYDLRLNFASGSGFDAGESVVYDILYGGAGAMSASSFAFLSQPAGGHGPYYAAAHVQNTAGGSGSGWIAPAGYGYQDVVPVPLPAPVALLALGGALLIPAAFRKTP